MRVRRTSRAATALVTLTALICAAKVLNAQEALSPPVARVTLSADQVVDNLVRRNQERAQALLHSEATRVYHLVYRGFSGDREATMTVEATYDSPSSKEFKIISKSGSKLVQERVFKKLLDSEKDAAQPAMSARTQLNRANYNFELVGYEPSQTGGQYVLQVSPKTRSTYVYRGKIWIDGTDFAVTRIEAEPAQNPSFWTKKSEIHHEYKKVDAFWLPARNESVSSVRMGGRATLIIEYKDYRVTDARLPRGAGVAPSSVEPTH
jgi:hypothetical protein